MFFPVVIATVFLTVIAMTGGFVLGERHRRAERAAGRPASVGGSGTAGSGATTGATASPTPRRVASRSATPRPGGSATPRPGRTGPLCPPQTQEQAVRLGYAGDLRQVFKVQTENGTTVWICQDADGGLFYQGKTGGPDAVLEPDVNGLFLPGVRRLRSDEYEAVAHDQNRIVVNRRQLTIFFTDRDTQTERVISD